MKSILTLFFTILIGCTSVTNATNISFIEKKYNNMKLVILGKCAGDANYIKKIAMQRDAGVPQKAMINWIMNTAKKEIKAKTMTPPLNTRDVLSQVMLITIIYNNPKISAESAYNQQNDFCTKYYFTRLDMIYKYEKLQLESKE